MTTEFVKQLNKTTINSDHQFLGQKRFLAKKLKLANIPKNSSLNEEYQALVSKGDIAPNSQLEKWLKLNPVRTQSGVAPVAVLTKPYPCPGKCIYCPNQEGVPKSYLTQEPAVDRAISYQYDPFQQTAGRLKALDATGHATQKVDLIIVGGTFLAYEKDYQEWFIKRCFDAANKTDSGDLDQAKKENERGPYRLIGISIETRPDTITSDSIKWLRYLGVTKVELGVQNLNDRILKKIKRGHTVKQVVQATRLLKNAGFKICYHIMPNLPGATLKSDLAMFKKLFADPRFRPDMLKIYPCSIVESAPLYQDFLKGDFQPYSQNDLTNLLVGIKKNLPEYVRVNRLIRDIPAARIVSGNKQTNLRQDIYKIMKAKGISCKCIRCREIKGQTPSSQLELKIKKYQASGGEEYFLSWVDEQNRLYGLLRLRFPEKKDQANSILLVLKNSALIREIHIYGTALPLGGYDEKSPQHQRLGQRLMSRAEQICRRHRAQRIAVIAGVGTRNYYQKIGYYLAGEYMIKDIAKISGNRVQ
ncbi:tRNA uridine(34) 5-carboxymethylaminomethyl modification radical SAM/GNAT enzyme Elp3 [candidate division WWE3 bacterium CG08_land_8_20_14_0_20_43_13]|uniref:tRNA carboxymethyluridine synthase n=1 Tax=candidate division WWE3 bacterium CG08_land_8_20_14_0_20_43_13 TaxID=1975087 RepID=A0A2H0X872_UNCKA|nr:MAG: tRNA uridine(34) 5-carboxymethylaminomethyl modification radical SAM/GNAT enzyme Elp3 [candidate division WWE3 bacterium CG08_land_8_20_14_0_20_43_13]